MTALVAIGGVLLGVLLVAIVFGVAIAVRRLEERVDQLERRARYPDAPWGG